jgi:hypothetical protein
MKILIPFLLLPPVEGDLMLVGFGQLNDNSARRFTLYRDAENSRLVLCADGLPENNVAVFDGNALAVALAGDEIPGESTDYVAQVDVSEETRNDCPMLLPMLASGDGKLELCVAINGWCVAARRDGRVVNLDVIHMATRVVQACAALPATSSAPVPEPVNEPPAETPPAPDNEAAPETESAEAGATAPEDGPPVSDAPASAPVLA